MVGESSRMANRFCGVGRDHRGQGIGPALARWVQAAAQLHGLRFVYLDCIAVEATRRFWSHMGFAALGGRPTGALLAEIAGCSPAAFSSKPAAFPRYNVRRFFAEFDVVDREPHGCEPMLCPEPSLRSTS